AGVILNRGFSYRIKVASYRLVKKIFPRYAEKHFGSKEYKTLSPVMRESYKKIVNEDLREDAKKIKNPVLLVYGEEDTTTPVKVGETYASVMENSRLEVMPHCGHFAFLDDVTSFNQITEEFLEN
ncbi:MAG: alpha/beta hydrolase, partial [Clostridia bacterium]|nr:alpha/beta hydrolase [Clostridia bacterium]